MSFDSSRLLNKRLFTRNQLVLLLAVVCLIPLFEPRSLSYLSGVSHIESLYTFGKLFSGLVAITLLLKKRVLNSLTISVILLSASMLISALMAGNRIFAWVADYGAYCIVVMLVIAFGDRYRREVLCAIRIVTGILLILNLLSMLAYPQGMYIREGAPQIDNYLWGNRNGTYVLALPAIISSLLLDDMKGRKIGIATTALIAISIFEVTYRYSAASTGMLILFLIGFALIQSKVVRNILNIYTYCLLYAVSYFAIVVVRIQDRFAWLLQDIFDRSVALSGRVYIWDRIIELMSEGNSAFGYGLYSNQYLLAINPQYANAHNMILDVWFCGGFVALACFVLMFLIVSRQLYFARKTRSGAIIALGIGCFMLVGLVEKTSCESLYLLLALGYMYGSQYRLANTVPTWPFAEHGDNHLSKS